MIKMITKRLLIVGIGILLLTMLFISPVLGMRLHITNSKFPNQGNFTVESDIVELVLPTPGQLIVFSQPYFEFPNKNYAIALFGLVGYAHINSEYVDEQYYYEWTILDKKTNKLVVVDGGFFCGNDIITGEQHISNRGSWYEFTINVYDHRYEPRNLLDSDSCTFYQLI